MRRDDYGATRILTDGAVLDLDSNGRGQEFSASLKREF
jgi:hypothetical protein